MLLNKFLIVGVNSTPTSGPWVQRTVALIVSSGRLPTGTLSVSSLPGSNGKLLVTFAPVLEKSRTQPSAECLFRDTLQSRGTGMCCRGILRFAYRRSSIYGESIPHLAGKSRNNWDAGVCRDKVTLVAPLVWARTDSIEMQCNISVYEAACVSLWSTPSNINETSRGEYGETHVRGDKGMKLSRVILFPKSIAP